MNNNKIIAEPLLFQNLSLVKKKNPCFSTLKTRFQPLVSNKFIINLKIMMQKEQI